MVFNKDSLSASERIVDAYCFDVIKMAMTNAGCAKGVITNTIRTPAEQVDIMYRNAKANLANQFQLYGANGDEVLTVFETHQQRPEAEVEKLIVSKIEELLKQDRGVSLHVITPEDYKKEHHRYRHQLYPIGGRPDLQ